MRLNITNQKELAPYTMDCFVHLAFSKNALEHLLIKEDVCRVSYEDVGGGYRVISTQMLEPIFVRLLRSLQLRGYPIIPKVELSGGGEYPIEVSFMWQGMRFYCVSTSEDLEKVGIEVIDDDV